MNCLTFEKLMQVLDAELEDREQVLIKQHLETCSKCKEKLEGWVSRDQLWTDTLFEPGEEFRKEGLKLNNAFTSNVMQEIARIKETSPALAQVKSHRGRSRNKGMKLALVFSAALVILVTAGSFVSPSFAEGLHSLFERFRDDRGTKTAAEQGFVVSTDASITDKGITFRVKEVIADPFRLSLVYDLNAGGKKLDAIAVEDGILPADLEEEVGTTKVKVFDDKGSPLNLWLTTRSEGLDGVMELVFNSPAGSGYDPSVSIPDRVVVHIQVRRINNVRGNWDVDVPVDFAKYKEASKELFVGKSFITPEGIRLDLNQIRLGPSAAGVYYKVGTTTAWENYRKRIFPEEEKYEEDNYHEISYQIKDEEGMVLGAYDGSFITGIRDGDVNISDSIQAQSGNNDFRQNLFLPFGQVNKLRFELTGLYVREQSDWKFTFKPADVKKGSVKTDYKGMQIKVTKVWEKQDATPITLHLAEEDARLNGKGLVIELETDQGLTKTSFIHLGTDLYMKDDYTHSYEQVEHDKAGNYKSHIWLFIPGASMHERITLSNDLVEKRIPQNWSVEIPVQ